MDGGAWSRTGPPASCTSRITPAPSRGSIPVRVERSRPQRAGGIGRRRCGVWNGSAPSTLTPSTPPRPGPTGSASLDCRAVPCAVVGDAVICDVAHGRGVGCPCDSQGGGSDIRCDSVLAPSAPSRGSPRLGTTGLRQPLGGSNPPTPVAAGGGSTVARLGVSSPALRTNVRGRFRASRRPPKWSGASSSRSTKCSARRRSDNCTLLSSCTLIARRNAARVVTSNRSNSASSRLTILKQPRKTPRD